MQQHRYGDCRMPGSQEARLAFISVSPTELWIESQHNGGISSSRIPRCWHVGNSFLVFHGHPVSYHAMISLILIAGMFQSSNKWQYDHIFRYCSLGTLVPSIEACCPDACMAKPFLYSLSQMPLVRSE